jgi:methionine aminopeptidase
VHIDGYIALVAHTIVVGDSNIDERKSNAILAAYHGVQAALRLLKAGNTNT